MYLHLRDFIESILDLSDTGTFPSNIVAEDQTVIQVIPGGSDAMPPVPFLVYLTIDKTTYELSRGETILVFEKDGTNPDLLHVCRDWGNYTLLEEPTEALLDGNFNTGDTQIDVGGYTPVVGDYIRIGLDPQLYRFTATDGSIEPPLVQDFPVDTAIQVIASQNPSSRARIHENSEEVLLISLALNFEEIQDAIRRLQEHPFPLDLTLDTLTLNYQLQLGGLRMGDTAAAGMVIYDGADIVGYVDGEWKSMTQQFGGGTGLPDGAEGEILAWLDGGWVPTNRIVIGDEDIAFRAGSEEMTFNDGGLLEIPSVQAERAVFSKLAVMGYDSPLPYDALNFGYSLMGSFIIGGDNSAPTPIALIGGSNNGAGGALFSSLLTRGHWMIQAEYEGAGTIILDADYQIAWKITGDTKAILSGSSFDLFISTFIGEQLTIGDSTQLYFQPRSDYPVSPLNGMVIYHSSAGFRGYAAGSWHDLTGDTLTFSAPGTAWSTVRYNPDSEEWEYTDLLLLTPGGAVFDTAIVIGQRADLMPEQLGLIEFRNNDFMGYVLDSNDELIRVSLTNIDPTQRLPSAAIAGTLMVATGEVWGAGLFADLHWNTDSKVLRADRMQIGSVGADGGAGTIRWADDQLQWNTGSAWAAFPTSASFGTPTILGSFLTALVVESALTWVETDAILFVDDHISIPTLHVETLILGGSELTGDLFNVQNLTATEVTVSTLVGTTATLTTLNVTNLNVAGSGEEDPLVLQLGRLDFKAAVPNSHVFNITPTATRLYVRYDETIDLAYYDFVNVDEIPGLINHMGGYAIGASVLSVDGFTEVILAGSRIEINGVEYVILSVSGMPTTQITLVTPLTTTVADNAVITVKYGYSRYTTAGDTVVGHDLFVNRLAKFAYTIQLAAYEGGYDGELDGLPDEPGMIRYNGDFQGRLESGQWVSFTRTMADGVFADDFGSLLWWDGSKWTKNTGLTVSVNGAAKIGTYDTARPGIIRFTGTDFQGCINEGVWVSMTSLLDLPSLPTSLYENATLRWSAGNWVVNTGLTSDGVKTTARLLELGRYEDFYDSGYVNHLGGYSSGADEITFTGFRATPNIGDIICFSNHTTEYEITDVDGDIFTIDPPLTVGVLHNQSIIVQGDLARPITSDGQVRYNANDYEGFVNGIGWVSFTGHVAQLPDREGDPLLLPGQILYFNGLNWVAYHDMMVDANGISIFTDLDVVGEFSVDGLIHASGIIVGAGQPPVRGYVHHAEGYPLSHADWILISGLPVALGEGNRVRFSVEGDTPIGQTQIYTITDIQRTSNVPTAIKVTPALVTSIPDNATVVFVDVLDPYAYPGLMYYNTGTQRFRGFVGVVGAGGEVDGEWLDLVSPIQIIPPVTQGQTLVWNDETQFWNNTPIWTLDHQDLGEGQIVEGYSASTLPVKIQEWSFKGTVEEIPDEEETLYNFQFELGCFFNALTPQTSYLRIETLTPNGSLFDILADRTAIIDLYVDGVAVFAERATFHSGIDLTAGNVRVYTGNVQLDRGDLSVLSGTVEGYRFYSDSTIWSNSWVRIGYTEGLAANLPIGALRYSLPGNVSRGDMEFWDGEQWVSMSAGFHGQAIWGTGVDGAMVGFDATYQGGKYRSFESVLITDESIGFYCPATAYYGLILSDLHDGDITPLAGKMKFDGSEFLGCINGTDWVSLSHTGSSGLADATYAGDTIAWDGSVYQPSHYLQVLEKLVKVNGVLQLMAYEDIDDPPTASAGQIRYNLNDYEAFFTGHGWVSLTGHVPFQNPTLYAGQVLYSDGAHWVANSSLKFEDTIFFVDPAATQLTISVPLKVVGQFATVGGAWIDGALMIGETLPTMPTLPLQGMLRTQRDGDDAWLEFYSKHAEDDNATWHRVMLGDYKLNDQDLGVVIYDQELGQYVNTDLIWLERDGADYLTVAVRDLDVRETLNFGNSVTDENYFRWAKTGSLLKLTVADAESGTPTPSYAFGPWEVSMDEAPAGMESGWDQGLIRYHDEYYFISETKEVYKRENGGWTQLTADHGMDAIKSYGLAVFDNYMWVIGGQDISNALIDTVYQSNDGITWTLVGNLPDTIKLGAAMGMPGDKIYLFGGEGAGGVLSTVYTSTDGIAWTDITANPSMPEISWATAVYFHDLFVLMGTPSGGGASGNIYFSPDAINWQVIEDPFGYGVGSLHSMGLTVLGDRLYMYGGWNNGSTIATVRYCTTSFSTWTTLADLPNAYLHPASTHVLTDEILFPNNNDALGDEHTYSYAGVQITGLIGDYLDFDLAGSMTAWQPFHFRELVDFYEEVDFHEFTHFLDGFMVDDGGQWTDAGLMATCNVTIGTVDENHTLSIHGDLFVMGEIYKSGEVIYVDRIINTGFLSVGVSDMGGLRISDIRYTGAKPCAVAVAADENDTTVYLKDVSVDIVTSIADEPRFTIKGHPTGYKILTAVDDGGGDWTITITPGLYADIAEDDVALTYVKGDWEGFDGENWFSFTNSASGGGGSTPNNQAFVAETTVTVTHGLGAYPVVQVIDNTGAVIVPLSIVHTNTNEFVVSFVTTTTGTIAW